MEVAVFDINGKETGRTVQLDESVFGIEPNDHAIYLDVKQYLANNRQGTHKAKERGEIKGSTKKIKKQKGTGGARAGSIKSPLFRGGGRVFGPRPHSYRFKLNQKLKRLARKSALSYKVKNDELKVVQDFQFEAPKTKSMVSLREKLSLANKKTLVILPEPNKVLYLSSRNLKGFDVVSVSELNTYRIMNAKTVVLTEQSLGKLEELFKS